MIGDIIILLLGIPSGYLIAHLCRDELVQGRKWFLALLVLSVIISAVFSVIQYKEIGFTLLFISIISLISYKKSFDKKWVRKR